jgi:hypothetical protein
MDGYYHFYTDIYSYKPSIIGYLNNSHDFIWLDGEGKGVYLLNEERYQDMSPTSGLLGNILIRIIGKIRIHG